MDVQTLKSRLAGLPIPDLRYFEEIGSTNDEALTWIEKGAQDGCLVVADAQTAGRGRLGRRWVTRPRAALAFSLIMRPSQAERAHLGFFSPLGALAICQSLEEQFGLHPAIKWPNDVLLERRKMAGILVEVSWLNDQLQGVVLGIGVNIASNSVPPDSEVMFPATSVEHVLGRAIDRRDTLAAILKGIFHWRGLLGSQAFFQGWEERLAFKDEWVQVQETGGAPLTGQVAGIDATGQLLLRLASGQVKAVSVGDVHLRLVE